jgi:hypothetical protein
MYSVSDDSKTMTNTSRQTVLETLNLQKTYRTGFWLNKKIESLKNCTLIVHEGETFGLLGRGRQNHALKNPFGDCPTHFRTGLDSRSTNWRSLGQATHRLSS